MKKNILIVVIIGLMIVSSILLVFSSFKESSISLEDQEYKTLRSIKSDSLRNSEVRSDGKSLIFTDDENIINITTNLIVLGTQYNLDSSSNWIFSNLERGGHKFGLNITIPEDRRIIINNGLEHITFNISSNQKDLEVYRNGFRYKKSNTKERSIENNKFVSVDFSDIINSFKVEKTFNHLVNNETVYLNVSIPHNISKQGDNIIINFDFRDYDISTLNSIYLDPIITLQDVYSYPSYYQNTSSENFPVTHLDTNSTNITVLMPFDYNGSLDYFDWSRYNNDGSSTVEMHEFSSGSPYDGFLHLNGANVVTIPDNDSLSFDTMSFSMWLRMDVDPSGMDIFGKYQEGGFEYMAGFFSGNLYWFVRQNSNGAYIGRFDNSGVWDDNAWHHIVGTYDGGTSAGGIDIYIDGTLQDDSDFSSGTFTAMENTGAPLYLGDAPAWNSNNLDGAIDNFILFGRELNSTQVNDIFQNQSYIYKDEGKQEFNLVNVQNNGTLNRVNITTNSSQPTGTNIEVRLGEVHGTDNYTTDVFTNVPDIWYRFDNVETGENTTTVVDQGSRSINISCNDGGGNCATVEEFKYFNGRNFDSTNDEFNGIDSDFIGNITIMAWVNLSDTGTSAIIAKGSGALGSGEWSFNADIGVGLNFECSTSSTNTANNLFQDEIHFVAVRFNEDTNDIDLFVDNERYTSTNTGSCLIDGTENIVIGSTQSTNFFGGLLDDIIVWEEFLDIDEIERIRARGGFDISYTPYQDVSDGGSIVNVFNISGHTNYTTIEYNLSTDSEGFLSPVLLGQIDYESWFETEGAVEDSCTYSTGDWDINCADSCVITTNVTIDAGNNISMTGAGTFTINDGVVISGHSYRFSEDQCYYQSFGSGGFR